MTPWVLDHIEQHEVEFSSTVYRPWGILIKHGKPHIDGLVQGWGFSCMLAMDISVPSTRTTTSRNVCNLKVSSHVIYDVQTNEEDYEL